MADTFGSFGAKLDVFARGLRDPELRKVMAEVGQVAQRAADRAAARDLGPDRAFSGWTRRSPIPLDTRVVHVGEGRIRIQPAPKGAGQWTVAELGRHPKAAFQGPSINQRTGTTARTRSGRIAARRPGRARRYSGETAGKGTATAAIAQMNRDTPPVFERGVAKAIREAGL